MIPVATFKGLFAPPTPGRDLRLNAGMFGGDDEEVNFMLRSFLSLCLFLMLWPSVSANAFELKSAGIHFGGGWMGQIYNYDGQSLRAPDRRLLFSAGIFVSSGLDSRNRWEMQFEALYIQKGFQKAFNASNDQGQSIGIVEHDRKGHCLSLPLFLKLRLNTALPSSYLIAGPSLEMLLDHDKNDVFDDMDAVTLGMHVGIGIDLGRVGVDVRYIRDLLNSYNTPYGATLDSVINDGVMVLFSADLLH